MHAHRPSASLLAGVVASLIGGLFLWTALRPVGAVVFIVAAAWGVVFGLAATLLGSEASFGAALLIGIVVGLAGDILDVAIVPATVPAAASFLGHVAFGASFVVAPLVFRALTTRVRRSPRVV